MNLHFIYFGMVYIKKEWGNWKAQILLGEKY